MIACSSDVNAQKKQVKNINTLGNRNNTTSQTLAGTTCTSTFIQKFTNLAGTGSSATIATSKVNIFPNPSGGFYITGLINDSTTISFFDNNDIIRWTRKFKFPLITNAIQQINSMFLNSDGDLIGVTDQGTYGGYIFKYNISTSNFVWIKQHSLYIPFIHSAGGVECIVTGTINSRTHLLRIDKSTGTTISYIMTGESGDFNSIVKNTKIYGTSRRYYNNNSDFRASLFSHDAVTGNFLWQKSLISETPFPNSNNLRTRMYPVPPVYDNDSLLMFASGDINGFGQYNSANLEVALTKTDTLGTPKWNIQYNFPFSDRPSATAICNTSDGYFLVGNFYSSTLADYSHGFIVKINKDGGVIWGKRLGISSRNQINKVLEQNGNIYVAMSSKSYSTTDDLLLIKMDKDGNTDTSCHLIIDLVVDTVNLKKIINDRSYTTNNPSSNLISKTAVVDSLKIEPETICIKCCKKVLEIIPNNISGKYCFGNSVCFSSKVNDSLNVTGGYKYKWYQKNSIGNWIITNANDTIPNPCISYTSTGIFTYRVIVSTNSGLCLDTSAIIITINPKPIANAGADKTICPSISTTIGTAALSGSTYAWASASGFTSTLATPSVSPSVTTTYYLTVTNVNTQCIAKDTVLVTVNNCQPIACIPCSTTISNTSKVSLINNNTTGISLLLQSFSFSDLPTNITEVRAVLTNIKIFAENENGIKTEECLSCLNDPIAWGSIVNGSTITTTTKKININGVETIATGTILKNQNPKQITWTNGGNVFAVSTPIELSFLLPKKSTLPCCTRKATICVKFIFRNDKCEECIVKKCFDVEIK